MSGYSKKKLEACLSVQETVKKLRSLADQLEQGFVTVAEEKCIITDGTQINSSQKAKGDTFSFKLKFKLANLLSSEVKKSKSALTSSSKPDAESYKVLKTRMAKDFKAIKKSCLQEHVCPESELVERFYRDAKTMCTYPNKGEEFYEIFAKQADDFHKAFKASDQKTMNTTIESLVQTRDKCHDKYK